MNFRRPWFLSTLLCLIYALAVILIRGNGDPLMLVTIGTDYSPADSIHAYSAEGYDGQFVYYIARDPSNAAPLIDVPAYRYQRILLPALGIVGSIGQDTLIPWALLAINLLALAAGIAILEHLLIEHKVSRWYAVGYGLSLGVFGAARLSTTETLAYALVLGAIWLIRQERWLWGAVLLALAALAKETTLVFVAAYGLYWLSQRKWSQTIVVGIIALLPFAIWQVILFNWFGEFGVGSGGNLATSFELIPFMGVLRILTEGGAALFGFYVLLIAPFVLIPTLWGLRQCWLDFRAWRSSDTGRSWTLYSWLLLLNVGIMPFIPFSTYREPLGILRFIVGLQIAVILYAAQQRNMRVLRNSTIWFVTSLLVIASDFAG